MLMRVVADVAVPIIDLFLAPLVLLATVLMKLIRKLGIWRMPIAKRIFNRVGVYPILDHYYEPMFNHPSHLFRSLRDDRHLPGIDMNEPAQLELLARFDYAEELKRLPKTPSDAKSFYYGNPNFVHGDAECLYSIIRLYKPKRIIEVGSGYSTMMAREAIKQNLREDANCRCRHICIEPYEMGWLNEVSGIEVLQQRVEQMDKQIFLELEESDILFIDSSHVIRPQGDVLCEFLEILPTLQSGVLVHIHDIFTPRDYPEEWLINQVKFWNEQYLLEAFMSCNTHFKIIAALNFLRHRYPVKLAEKFPMLGEKLDSAEPGSFWIQKVD
jgi:hypothetical protein